ncbi:MAG: hypothetical protein HQL41_19110 [Alphaproteobacteria bacterium]|nr:hypothetical protein [Alphaproteobacteria bacterium]
MGRRPHTAHISLSETNRGKTMPGREQSPVPKPHDANAKQPARENEDEVQESSEDSFPASDPPSFTHSHAGKPKRGV